MKRFFSIVAGAFLLAGNVFGYVCNTGSENGLNVTLNPPPQITAFDTPVDVTVTLENRTEKPLDAGLRFFTQHPLYFPESKSTTRRAGFWKEKIPAQSTVTKTVKIVAGKGAYNAHYPVSLHVGKIHVVYPVEVAIPRPDVKPNVRSTWTPKIIPWTPQTFTFSNGMTAELAANGKITFRTGDRTLVFNGLEIQANEGWSANVRQNGDALEIVVAGDPSTFQRVAFAPCSQRLAAFCFGNGYYVRKPGAFSLPSNGHQNATSFVGWEFANGISLLMASSFPIEQTYHEPDTNRVGMACIQPTTFTLLPSVKGVFDAAVRYRSICPRQAARGVATKAGRFCVDFWNGTFPEHAAFLKTCAEKYGLKNDLILLSHNWQRYHYDHRLPDVYPPNPLFGTAGEMKEIARLARKYGWFFGLHVNVVDYYPDSSTFTFNNVSFLPDGQPQKAYKNVFLDAQSYRLAPHRAAGVMKETLDLMNADGLKLDTLFVDVIGSFPARPYYGYDGKYFSQTEARDGIRSVFDTIRNTQDQACQRPTFTNSEATHDYLIGHLDGGDCQFMYLSREGGEYRWLRIPEFEDCEKVPWFDLVNHRKISLHGVGYSIRYEGGRGRDFHGIDSDDYLSAEILTGHALMTDGGSRDVKEVLSGYVRNMDVTAAVWQTVRKYWLAQCVVRETAHDDIASVEFIGGDIHRLKIVWQKGTTIHVNRGKTDWTVEGVVLPSYGYLARNPKTGMESMIYRLNGRVVEQSSYRDGDQIVRYANPRHHDEPRRLPVSPAAAVTFRENGKIHLHTDWNILQGQPTPSDTYQLSFWLVRRKGAETNTSEDFLLKTVEADFTKPLDLTLALPPEAKGKWDILVSVAPLGTDITHVDNRQFLLATPSFFHRYHLGVLEVGKAFTPFEETDTELYPRMFQPKEIVDFGWCQTDRPVRQVFN
ncbi:MAG: hypothetical protein Q4D98_12410 [Planctomycetia bacterium]|nr:hypothetical protein [Planctomycetia bacterium]